MPTVHVLQSDRKSVGNLVAEFLNERGMDTRSWDIEKRLDILDLEAENPTDEPAVFVASMDEITAYSVETEFANQVKARFTERQTLTLAFSTHIYPCFISTGDPFNQVIGVNRRYIETFNPRDLEEVYQTIKDYYDELHV